MIAASDGYPLEYRRWAPAGEPRATLILLNGVMSHSAWFEPLATRLSSFGFLLVGADRRGSGMNRQARGDTPNAAQLVADVRAIIAEEHRAARPLYLIGWCWGAVLAVNVALELGPRLKGLVLLAPGLYPTKPLKDEMAAELARKAELPEDACELSSPIVEEMFTAGPALESFIKKDELRLKKFTPRFHKANVKLAMNAVMRLKTLPHPMLLVLASRDSATDNTDTLTGFNRLPSTQVRTTTLESMHGIQFDQPDALAAAIKDWIDV